MAGSNNSESELNDMLPASTIYDSRNITPRDAGEFRSNKAVAFHRFISIANGPNVIGGQFRVPVFCTDIVSALCNHVAQVVCTSPDEQVRGIDAGRIVAMVTDKHSGGYGSNDNFIDNPMGEQNSFSNSDSPVSSTGQISRPFNATALCRRSSQEPDAFDKRWMVTGVGTVNSPPPNRVCALDLKFFPACNTDAGNLRKGAASTNARAKAPFVGRRRKEQRATPCAIDSGLGYDAFRHDSLLLSGLRLESRHAQTWCDSLHSSGESETGNTRLKGKLIKDAHL
jgi:hypothetical protein